jgi:hypothetical protein
LHRSKGDCCNPEKIFTVDDVDNREGGRPGEKKKVKKICGAN